ncbi:hypothetical protein Tco_0026823 [Tanacetum coccineum]
MKRMGQDIVQDSIWEHYDDSKEDQEEDGDDGDTFNIKPFTTESHHPNDDYVAPATKSILDELLEELGDEILNITMVDDEADIIPTKDLEELERLLAKEPQSNFTEIQVDRDITSPERYDLYSSFPYPVAYLNPKGVYCYLPPTLDPVRRWTPMTK